MTDHDQVRIGDRVAIAPRVTLVVSSTPNWSKIVPYVATKHAPITIEDDVWVGSGTVVLPGVTIGQGAVVGANSVVSKEVRPYTIVWGVPARFIGEVPARDHPVQPGCPTERALHR
jgi:galactoside O-acetyltransferase